MSKFKHKFMLKIRSSKQGFSLIELLVTISIIGILAAVAVPAYNTYKKDAKIGVLKTTTNVVAGALRTCLALNSVNDCKTVALIQVKNDSDEIEINTANISTGSVATKVCYNITGAGFSGKANGCVDSAGTKAFCKWNGDAAPGTLAACTTAGVCTPTGSLGTTTSTCK